MPLQKNDPMFYFYDFSNVTPIYLWVCHNLKLKFVIY
jgi:hypothetical protein